MAGFSLKGLLWKETLQVNAVRAFVAGIVWTAIGTFITIADPTQAPPLGLLLMMPIGLPIGYFLCYLPLGIIAGWLSAMGVPFIGLLSFAPAIVIIPADPFVFFLHKAAPKLVPIEKYRFIEPTLSIWVFDVSVPTMMEQVAESVKRKTEPNNQGSNGNCPFKGRVLVDKDTKVMGFNWPAKATAFEINEDWSVETPNDRSYGWIDVNGEIHKGRPFGAIDPKATLSGGSTGIKISGAGCWAGNDKVGELVNW